jgi:signal transduction histidine kinase
MVIRFLKLGQLQRKLLWVISTIVIVPMLVAGWLASQWVAKSFEERIEQWITDAARVNQSWLQAYQSGALKLGRVLAEDQRYLEAIERRPGQSMPAPLRRISQELGVNLIQVYTPRRQLLYTSLPVQMQELWEPGQREAVLKVRRQDKSALAAVGITPVPRRGPVRYYLVLGSLIGQDFTEELSQLTGLQTRLYYREGEKYLDVFSKPEQALARLPAPALVRLEKEKKPYYSAKAENGEFRGLYTPMVDSTGHVEAIIFSGLPRRGFQEVLTNRLALFGLIAVAGVVIGALTGLLLSRIVVRPLRDLHNGVMQLAGQNFNASVPVRSHDELGDLAKAFNAMAARLREARDEQAQRFQKDKLAAMGEVSAALAHEIRNPLGVISTSAALLEGAQDDARSRNELTRMIREESMRVSNLVQDFLQLSRHRQPVFAAIDPVEPMERALTLALAGREGVHVHRGYDHDQARILADAGLLQQAWANLYANALAAMNGRGELWLAAEVVGARVRLLLEDSGPGIAPEIMPRLFEPFFTTRTQGTGLGLTIAYTLTEANGGRLEAQARRHRGARFAMEFPIYMETFTNSPAPLAGEGKGRGRRAVRAARDLVHSGRG